MATKPRVDAEQAFRTPALSSMGWLEKTCGQLNFWYNRLGRTMCGPVDANPAWPSRRTHNED